MVGIVASRLVERHHRPVVVISLDGEGGWPRQRAAASPASICTPALEACSEHLLTFGGHRAAAGLSLREENLDAFREAFAAHAAALLGPEDLRRTERIDAMVGGVGLGLDLAEELGQLAPFGMGNPGVRLMVPSARVTDVRTMGEGKHARFSLHSGAHRALGVAFGRSSLGVEDDDPVDAAVRLEVNHWNGSVEPRVVLRELYPLEGEAAPPAPGGAELRPTIHACDCEDAEWWQRFEAELARELPAIAAGGALSSRIAGRTRPGPGRTVVSAAVRRRWRSPSWSPAAPACWRSAPTPRGGRSWPAAPPGSLASTAAPAASPAPAAVAPRSRPRPRKGRGVSPWSTTRPWRRRPTTWPRASSTSSSSIRRRSCRPRAALGQECMPAPLPTTGPLARLPAPALERGRARVRARGPRRALRLARRPSPRVFRDLRARAGDPTREAGEVSGPALRRALAGSGAHPRSAEAAARCFRVLAELGLVAGEPEAAPAASGSYPQREPIWSAQPRSGPTEQTTGGSAIPRKTQTAVEHCELLADLFAVVEEFDSSADENGNGNGNGGGTALAVATIDRAAVERAFDFACDRHADQMRHSGDEFITHPVGVAQICAGMRLDTETLCAALLHDTVEDTSASLEEIREEFGEEIALLVDGVTKLTGMTFESRDERQAENYRKMMVAMATDVRVILIKLADRLHNMRTLGALPKQKQTAKSHETLEIYAPLAHRLGIHAIKWELEDLAFATLHPRKYTEIKQLVAQQRDERESYVSDAGTFLAEELEQVGIEAEISGRAKHFYSIYTKMAKKGREFNEIFDLTAMRVIVGSVKDCYGAIGVIHSLWKPLPGRFKDFVAMPKANMYQALHTTVIGPEGKPLEIQIRTEEMHKLAEYGIAAHVAYKEGGGGDPQREKMTWLRQLVEAEGEQDPAEFLESLKVDLFEDEVFVFTPKGEVKNLSAGSTPLDFAYAVHTDVGHRCVGAKVNGTIVPLHYQLRSGDIVEVLTAKQKRGPSRDWLKLVRTSRARNKIRAWFKEERREDAERNGREGLDEALRTRGLPMQKIAGSPLLADVIREMGYRKGDRLLHRPRPGQGLDQDGRQQADAAAESRRGGRGAGRRR